MAGRRAVQQHARYQNHRADLTALERDQQVARWIELTDSKPASADVVLRQPDAKPKGGRPEGGTRAAARELGLAEADARRAIKVAGLSDEAKETARQAGLDDNRTALLAQEPGKGAQFSQDAKIESRRADGKGQRPEGEVIFSQVAKKSKSDTNPKGSGRHEGGINAAARELSISKAAPDGHRR